MNTTTLNAVQRLGCLVASALLFAVPCAAQQGAAPAELEFLDEEVSDEELFADEAPLEEAPPAPPDPPPAAEPADDAQGDDATRDGPLAADADPPQFDAIDPGALPPSPDVEEIVVKGRSGEGVAVDAPVSVTAFDAEFLEAMGVADVADIATFTPNLEIRTAGATTPTFFIRGVGLNDFTANASGAVAIYQDDVALDLPALQLGQIFDVEKVDVLRGPQGTGAGRNASAGAIRVYSRKPTGETSAFVRMDYGRFNFVDLEGALEVPLLDDLVSTRMAFRFTERDGIVDNRCGGSPVSSNDLMRPNRVCDESGQGLPGGIPLVRAGLESDLNDIGLWASRAQFRFVPPQTDMEWLLNLHGGRVDQLGQVGQTIGTNSNFFGSSTAQPPYNANEISDEQQRILEALGGLPPRQPGEPASCSLRPNCVAVLRNAQQILANRLSRRPLDTKPFEGDYNLPGHERQDTIGGFVRGEWQLPRYSITSVTGYEHYDRERLLDADYTSNRIFEFSIEDDSYQVSQDVIIEGELEDIALAWDAGGYYLTRELDYFQNTLASGDIQGLIQEYSEQVWSFGIFGGFDWEFADAFELEGGVRFNWERKRFEVAQVLQSFNRCEDTLIEGQIIEALPCDDRVTKSAPTGTLSLRYAFDDDVSAYAKYSRGWKGPQYNVGDGAVVSAAITKAQPESIDAFEVGFAGSWFDGRLDLKGALFWYSYSDYQVFLITNDFGQPPQRRVENADDARIFGAELEGRLEPLERLVLNARFGWIESKFLDFTRSNVRVVFSAGNPPPPPRVFEVPIEFTGNRLPNTPRFKLSGGVEYSFELGRYGALVPRYDFSFTDEVFFDPSEGRGAPNNQGRFFMPDHAIGQKAYWLHSARLTYRTPAGNLELSGWVRNLSDEVYKTLAFDASASAGLVGNLVGDPRTYGVSLAVSF